MKKVIVFVLAVLLMAGVCSCAWASVIDGHFGNGTVGTAYEGYFRVLISGLFRYDISLPVPPGLSWKEETTSEGATVLYLRGTPTEAGDYKFTVTVTYAGGSEQAKYTIHIDKASSGGGSSSGCNPGFGLPGLMLAALLFRKSRR